MLSYRGGGGALKWLITAFFGVETAWNYVFSRFGGLVRQDGQTGDRFIQTILECISFKQCLNYSHKKEALQVPKNL